MTTLTWWNRAGRAYGLLAIAKKRRFDAKIEDCIPYTRRINPIDNRKSSSKSRQKGGRLTSWRFPC